MSVQLTARTDIVIKDFNLGQNLAELLRLKLALKPLAPQELVWGPRAAMPHA